MVWGRFFSYSNVLIFLGLAYTLSTCKTQTTAPLPVQLPLADIRLEFRGQILKLPPTLQPPYQFRARAYSCPGWEESFAPRVALEDYPECMVSYVEKIVDFEGLEYRVDLDVPSNWSHAYIELVTADTVKGMFSPGHNPNWFNYSEGEIITFRHDFVFRSQENPIPDRKQMDLAEKFSPILVLDPQKKSLPSNLEKFNGRYEIDTMVSPLTSLGLRRNRYEPPKLPFMILPNPNQIPGYDADIDPIHIYAHVRYANTQVSGTQPESLPGYRDDRNYWYEIGDGRIVVSYWIWFDENHGPSPYGNYHQGDWESYSVLCDSQGKPLRILITGHGNITLDTQWKNINSLDFHPILYVGSGRNSEGSNALSAYGNHSVHLDAGSDWLNWIVDPQDIFPNLDERATLVLPFPNSRGILDRVVVGSGSEGGKIIRLSDNKYRTIDKIVLWEEPGWINKPARDDPDGHHRVDPRVAEFLEFNGHLGKHPTKTRSHLRLKEFGTSPRNAPFKINIEQHYTYERPRYNRSLQGRSGDYGPKFMGNPQTPQFFEFLP